MRHATHKHSHTRNTLSLFESNILLHRYSLHSVRMAKFVKKMFTWSIAPVYIADQEVDPPSRSDVSYCVLTQLSYLGWLSKPSA